MYHTRYTWYNYEKMQIAWLQINVVLYVLTAEQETMDKFIACEMCKVDYTKLATWNIPSDKFVFVYTISRLLVFI